MKSLRIASSHTKASALVAAFVVTFALPAGAATVLTVLNHSFENPQRNDNQTNTTPPDWTEVNVGGNSLIFNPPTSWFSSAAGNNTPTGGDGANVLSASVNNGGTNTTVSQTLDAQFSAGTTYTMTVAVGDFLGRGALDFELEFAYFNGTSTVVLASYFGDSSVVLTDDQMDDFEVSFTALALQPYIGEDLIIRLRGIHTGAAENQNVAFDNVRVTIPEPSSALLGGLGMLLLLRRRNR